MSCALGRALPALLLLAHGAWAQQALRHDMFSPAQAQAPAPTAKPERRPAPGAPVSVQAPRVVQDPVRPAPQLTAVIDAGADSMVLANGVVLRLAQSLEGYQLLRVEPPFAVFMKNGKEVVLGVKNAQPPGNNAQSKEKQ